MSDGMPPELYKRVIIIGVDGCGNYPLKGECPNIKKFLSESAHSYFAKAQLPTISAQNWGSMLHGVEPSKHGLTNPIVEQGTPYPEDSSFPSIVKILESKRTTNEEFNAASIVDWSPINTGIFELSLKMYKYSYPEDEHETWYKKLWRKLRELVLKKKFTEDDYVAWKSVDFIKSKKNKNTNFLFIYFATVDNVGHENGYGGEKYMQNLSYVDGLVGNVLTAIKKAGWEDDSLIILTTDHGGKDWNHGGDSKEEVEIIWGAKGKNIKPGKELHNVTNMDVAAVTLTAFGVETPNHFDSKVPFGLWIAKNKEAEKVEDEGIYI
nr:9650_t:CDS:1 [Entrophospora candida]CAG8660395.1 6179_t:CDS:1 [Entrophospora candida]